MDLSTTQLVPGIIALIVGIIVAIYGRDRVLEKMKEVLNSAERFASISTPKLRELRQELGKEIESAITRNVTVQKRGRCLPEVQWESPVRQTLYQILSEEGES